MVGPGPSGVEGLLERALRILACPSCGGELKISGSSLICVSCGASYRVYGERLADFLGPGGGWVGVFERFPGLYDIWAPVGWRLIGWKSLEDLYGALVEGIGRGTLVDVGCGTGSLVKILEGGFEGLIVCLDISRAMLSRAAQKSKRALMVRASMERLPLSRASVDFYVSSLTIHISNSKRAVFSEMSRVLKPGGAARIAVVTADTRRGRLFARLFGLEPLLPQHYIELGASSALDLVKVRSLGSVKIFYYAKRAS